jgi:hypothetical protein
MNNATKIFLAIASTTAFSACQTNPAARLEPGSYNYTPGFIWGETTAVPVSIPSSEGRTGYAITCREIKHCLSRGNDLCSPRSILIVSSDVMSERSSGVVGSMGGGGSRTTETLMQVQCIDQ